MQYHSPLRGDVGVLSHNNLPYEIDILPQIKKGTSILFNFELQVSKNKTSRYDHLILRNGQVY